MKRLLLLLISVFALNYASAQEELGPLDRIIPQPKEAILEKGRFKLVGASFKCDNSMDKESVAAVKRFATRVSLVSGKTSSVSTPMGLKSSAESESAKGVIFLKDSSLAPEEYSIKITGSLALIKASELNGFIYSIQTLMQLLPESIFGTSPDTKSKWYLPCCTIKDKPMFGYRGMHMDSSRHFWDLKEVKRYIDVMSFFKLNRLHWHLSDDQGWRIEIKSLPLLTQIAAWREGTMIGRDFGSNDGIRYGGFYTQEEIREVIKYAAERGITIIPEIDLPGHMLAALSAYPQLGCTGGPYAAWTQWGISDQVLCAGKEETYTFLETVLGEVADLFPSEYVHIGGDECPKVEWEKCPHCQAKIEELGLKDDERFSAEQYLQTYVTKRMQDFLATKGKKIIGWDEILEGEIAPGATVMSWRGMNGAQEAASMGFNSILTPTSHFYFDYCQSQNPEEEPLGIGGFVSLEKVYSFQPFEGIPEDKRQHILGVQANLWTEYIKTPEHLEYMLLPRLLALSEVQWCTPEERNFEDFNRRLNEHGYAILDNAGYNYRRK